VQEYVGKSVVGTVPCTSLLLHVHYMRPSLCIREFNVSDSLKTCLEMVLFVDISGETAVPGDEPFQLWLE
jgi:chorismate mutase